MALSENLNMDINDFNTPLFQSLYKMYRDANGIKINSDINQLNNEKFFAILDFLEKNPYFAYLLKNELEKYWELYGLLKKRNYKGSREKELESEENLKKELELQAQTKVKKESITQVSADPLYVVYPIDFKQFEHLPKSATYAFLYSEYKKYNFMYQAAQAQVYQQGHQAHVHLTGRIAKSGFVSTFKHEIKHEAERIHTEMVAIMSEIESEFKHSWLHADGSPDHESMERRATYLKAKYDDATRKINRFFDDIEDKVIHEFKHEFDSCKQEFQRTIQTVQIELASTDARFKPILTQLEGEMRRLNAFVVDEVNDNVKDFDKVLTRSMMDLKHDDKLILEKFKSEVLRKLPSKMNKDSFNHDQLKQTLNEFISDLDKINHLFQANQPLAKYKEQFDSLRDSIDFKANFKANTLEELKQNASTHQYKPSAPVVDEDYYKQQAQSAEPIVIPELHNQIVEPSAPPAEDIVPEDPAPIPYVQTDNRSALDEKDNIRDQKILKSQLEEMQKSQLNGGQNQQNKEAKPQLLLDLEQGLTAVKNKLESQIRDCTNKDEQKNLSTMLTMINDAEVSLTTLNVTFNDKESFEQLSNILENLSRTYPDDLGQVNEAILDHIDDLENQPPPYCCA
ncbi:MAG: hypothetical protein WC627_01485 [Legionella sp.]